MSSRSLMLAVAALLGVMAGTAQAQETKLTWGPAPPALPAGALFALVSGDPGKAGPFEIQLSMPDGYTIPPHWHPTDENVTVISGHFHYGMGDTIDGQSMKSLDKGQSVNLKANMRHYARAEGPTVVSVSGNGPFEMTYVNQADDPRHREKHMAKPKLE